MLESLYIRNYRLFRELRINSLKRVNLIIGKNNVGKSSLLEATHIYLNKEDILYPVYEILNNRGEWESGTFRDFGAEGALASLKGLFNWWNHVSDSPDSILCVGKNENEIIYIYLSFKNNNPIDLYEDYDFKNIEKIFFTVKENNKIVTSHNLRKLARPSFFISEQKNKYQMVKSSYSSDQFEIFYKLWSQIALTEKESYVIEALKIIDKNIERIAFVGESLRNQNVIVKLQNLSTPVSLKSMGDGIGHILGIILNAVQCENGALLIDEFENGLHWSVQAELWKIIFHLAYKLNIQIFATTHSRDTLWALQKIAISEGYQEDTRVIKLKHSPKKQTIKAIELDIENVKDVLEQGLEIR